MTVWFSFENIPLISLFITSWILLQEKAIFHTWTMDISGGSPFDLGMGAALVDIPAAQSECGYEIANVDTKMAQKESINDPAIHESISNQPVVMDVDHGDSNDDELSPLVIDLSPVDPHIPVHTEKVAITGNTFPAGKNPRKKHSISTSLPSYFSKLRYTFIFSTFYSIWFFMATYLSRPSIFHGHSFSMAIHFLRPLIFHGHWFFMATDFSTSLYRLVISSHLHTTNLL